MMKEVTNEQVTATIEAVVAEAGEDFVYPRFGGDGDSCYYVQGGEASCIVGKVLHRLGATLYDLGRCDQVGRINREVLETVGIEMSDSARFALREAQETQDLRRTWGEALNHYKHTLARQEQFA